MLPHPLSKAAHDLLVAYRGWLQEDGATERYRDETHGICRRYLLTLPSHDPAASTRATWRAFLDNRAPGTAELYGGTVLRFLRWCNLEGHARIDPKVLRLKPPKAHTAPPRDLTHDQVTTLLEHLATDRRMLIGVLLQQCAGLRRAEVVTATVERIYLGHINPWIEVCGKGAKIRRVPLPDDLADILRAELAGRTHGPILTSKVDPSRPICPQHYSELYRRARRAAGLGEDVVPHRHRHTYATWLLQSGVMLEIIRDLLGQSSVVTTERYTGGFDPDLFKVVRRHVRVPGRLARNRVRPGNRRPRPTVASQPGVVGYRVRGRARRRR